MTCWRACGRCWWGWVLSLGRLVWDNEPAIGAWRAGRPVLTDQPNAFRGVLGVRVVQCRPRDPEAKGLVERVNGYLETSFLPGRTFTGPQDFNTQLSGWVTRANQRVHRRLDARPVDRLAADRAGMVELPPVGPVVGLRIATRLPRDHYVRLAGNDYSVHPEAVGRLVETVADHDQVVVVTCGGREVARHVRCWASRQTVTDPTHAAAAAELRRVLAARPPARTDTDVEHRALSDYDRHFGLDDDTQVA